MFFVMCFDNGARVPVHKFAQKKALTSSGSTVRLYRCMNFGSVLSLSACVAVLVQAFFTFRLSGSLLAHSAAKLLTGTAVGCGSVTGVSAQATTKKFATSNMWGRFASAVAAARSRAAPSLSSPSPTSRALLRFGAAGLGLSTAAAGTTVAMQAAGGGASGDRGEPSYVKEIQDARRRGRKGMFPPIEPFNTGTIQVETSNGTTHSIYYEECGNPNGQPVLFVHGGPGGGIGPQYRRFHDPKHYRIILFDQRGCGKSTPHASLDENTTWDLVADMEKIRDACGIEKWHLFGGSWGSTLSLAYAETHPDRVSSMVLRGIFLLRRKELEWYYEEGGASFIFPDRFAEFKKAIPAEEHGSLITAYRKRLVGKDSLKRIQAARAWTQWENTTSNLFPVSSDEVKGDGDNFALAFARIENHFFHNGGFFEWDGWLLDNVDRIRHIPTVIVQGRYDVVCPVQSAWDLHQAFPEADFKLIKDSGHSCMEYGTLDALIEATESFKQIKD